MNRLSALDLLRASTPEQPFDFVIIGGGATGLGCAVDAAARGYRTALIEQHDFAKATSSRSTKLVHGGVRYLQQGNISLVLEALHERGLLCQNAPHLVRHMEFIVPAYSWWEGPFYGIGLKIYDRLAGKLGLHPSRILSREETLRRIPTLEQHHLLRGVSYYDGQFDDARLAINLAQTFVQQGGTILNYAPATRLLKDSLGIICGVVAHDAETGEELTIYARGVINATGVFSDTVRHFDNPEAAPIITASQGAHIVLGKEFLPGDTAIMVPHTPDGRVLFAIPWHDRVVVGTTDQPVDHISLEPRPMEDEINFILDTAAQYLAKPPTRSDILSAFAGLRPLVKSGGGENTAALSRDHTILISDSGLITIAGGKWTTYRRMAQDTIDKAESVAGFDPRPCPTEHLRIHGAMDTAAEEPTFAIYGSDAPALRALIEQRPDLAEPLHPRLPILAAQVVWGAQHEMARSVEDILSRRTRALLLDARASIEAAPKVATLLAKELTRNEAWVQDQIRQYEDLAQGYVIGFSIR